MAQIKSEYLKGLKFTGSNPKKEKTESGEKVRHIPFDRALRPADVLDFKLTKAGLVVVAADGQKHTVELSAADRKKLEGELAESQNDTTAE